MTVTKEQYIELEKLLGELQLATIKRVLASVQSDEASPSDIKNALTLLKDNSITLDNAKGDPKQYLGNVASAVAAALPYTDAELDDDYEDDFNHA